MVPRVAATDILAGALKSARSLSPPFGDESWKVDARAARWKQGELDEINPARSPAETRGARVRSARARSKRFIMHANDNGTRVAFSITPWAAGLRFYDIPICTALIIENNPAGRPAPWRMGIAIHPVGAI